MYCTYAKYQHLKMFQMFCPTPGDMLVPYQFEPELSADSASQVDAAHGVDVSGRLGHMQWCICGSNCASMNLELENVC